MNNKELAYRKFYVFGSIFTGAIGFFEWGYALTVFNSVLSYFEDFLFPGYSNSKLSFIASILTIGGIGGALVGGHTSMKWGRRKVLLVTEFIFLLGAGLTVISNYVFILIGRFLEGFVIGINSCVTPIYLIEIAPKRLKGFAGTFNIFLLASGSMVAYGVGFIVPKDLAPGETSNAWRICMGILMVTAAVRILFFLLFFRKETPFYLVLKNQIELATQSLKKIYKGNTKKALDEVIKEKNYMASTTRNRVRIRDLFKKKYRKAFLVCLTLPIIREFCGLSAIFVFSNVIFEEGLDEGSDLPNTLSAIIGALNLVVAVVAIWIIERYGRKKPLLFGLSGLVFIYGLYALIGFISDPGNLAGKIVLVSFPIFFGVSIGGMMFLYLSEVLPDIGMSICMLLDWVLLFLITQFFLDVSDAITYMGVFLIFGGVCLVGVLFHWAFMIESKGKSKSEMLSLYSGIRVEEIKPDKPLEELSSQPDSANIKVGDIVS